VRATDLGQHPCNAIDRLRGSGHGRSCPSNPPATTSDLSNRGREGGQLSRVLAARHISPVFEGVARGLGVASAPVEPANEVGGPPAHLFDLERRSGQLQCRRVLAANGEHTRQPEQPLGVAIPGCPAVELLGLGHLAQPPQRPAEERPRRRPRETTLVLHGQVPGLGDMAAAQSCLDAGLGHAGGAVDPRGGLRTGDSAGDAHQHPGTEQNDRCRASSSNTCTSDIIAL